MLQQRSKERIEEETSTIREKNDPKAQSQTESFIPKSNSNIASKSVIMIKSIYKISEHKNAFNQIKRNENQSQDSSAKIKDKEGIKEFTIINMNSAGVEQAVSKNDKFASEKVNHKVFKK